MSTGHHAPLSVLDLSTIVQGSNASAALKNTVSLAQHTERLGFNRFWLAEHHNFKGIASAATAVVMAHVAGNTTKIRVGSGGIMLPNHAPLIIAEQFGTLESLFPGRIDLGLGRAPGTDRTTMMALRRDPRQHGDDFPELLNELRAYFKPAQDNQLVVATPGAGLDIPIWLLGSSGFSAQLAGMLGLPFAFAGQFAPAFMVQAFELYRNSFKPSEVLSEPYGMIGANVIAADTVAEAEYLATSHQLSFLHLIRGRPAQLPPPVKHIDMLWEPHEAASVKSQLACTVVGDAPAVKAGLEALLEKTGAQEVIINSAIYDHTARLKSYEITAKAWGLAQA